MAKHKNCVTEGHSRSPGTRNKINDISVGEVVEARVDEDAVTPWKKGVVSRKLSRGKGALYDVRFEDGTLGRELTRKQVRRP